jgi:hypothetical protein
MSRTRALMTETETAYIARDVDATENQRYQAIARVRDRIDALERDIETLKAHHPSLLKEIRAVACPDSQPMTDQQPVAIGDTEHDRFRGNQRADCTDSEIDVQRAITAIEMAQARGDRTDVEEALDRALETLRNVSSDPT